MTAPNRTQYIFGVYDPVSGKLLGVTPSGNTPYSAIPGSSAIVSTFAALRLQLGTQVQTVIATGKFSQSDGSGGTFVFNAADTTSGAWFVGTVAGSVLTVLSVNNGTLAVGQSINRGDTGASIGTITSLGTGSGGTGTYNLSASATISQITFSADNNSTTLVGIDGSRWNLATTVSALVGPAIYGTDSGAVNAYVFTHSVTDPPATLAVGTVIRLTVNTTNTSSATLNADGTGAVAVIRANGSALTGGELSSLGPVVLQSTGTQWQIVSTAGAQPGDERTTAETTATPPQTPLIYIPTLQIDLERYGGGIGASTALNNAALNSAIAVMNKKVGGILVTRGAGIYDFSGSGYSIPGGAIIQGDGYATFWRNQTIGTFNISGITQANPAVITMSTVSGSNPLKIGDVIMIQGVVGMTQINSQEAQVSAIGGSSGAWTASLGGGAGINSSAYTAYASGGTAAQIFLTTPSITNSGGRSEIRELQLIGPGNGATPSTNQGIGLLIGDPAGPAGFMRMKKVLMTKWGTALQLGGCLWGDFDQCEFGNPAGGAGVYTNNVGIDFSFTNPSNQCNTLAFKTVVVSNNANAGVQATNVAVNMNEIHWTRCNVQNNCQNATGNPQFYMGNVVGFTIDDMYMEYLQGGTPPDAIRSDNLNGGRISNLFCNTAANGIKDRSGGAMNQVDIWRPQFLGITTAAVSCASEHDVHVYWPVSLGGGTVTLTGTGCGYYPAGTKIAAWATDEASFTPVLTPASNTITQTVHATYSQVGNVVHFQLRIDWTSLGTASGGLTVTGFPIAANVALSGPSWAVGYFTGITPVASSFLALFMAPGSTTATIYATGATAAQLTVAALAAAGTIDVCGTYHV